jgi:tetratricopeptide (TPR) repeat protein
MLTASGAPATPEQLRPLLHVTTPESLPYRFGRLTYQVAPELSALHSELDQKHPVLVELQRRYLVLMDYDPQTNTLVVRAGRSKPQVLSAYEFVRQWESSQRWAMLVLRPGDLPAELSRQRYFDAATAFERDARPESLVLVFDAALRRWHDEPLAWAGRATAKLRAGNLIDAARDYSTSLRIDGSNTEVRHQLALTLLYLGCTHKAQSQINKISLSALRPQERALVEDSRGRIKARSQNLLAQDPPVCSEFSF